MSGPVKPYYWADGEPPNFVYHVEYLQAVYLARDYTGEEQMKHGDVGLEFIAQRELLWAAFVRGLTVSAWNRSTKPRWNMLDLDIVSWSVRCFPARPVTVGWDADGAPTEEYPA